MPPLAKGAAGTIITLELDRLLLFTPLTYNNRGTTNPVTGCESVPKINRLS